MPEDIDPIPEYAPGEGYAPARPKDPEPAPSGGKVTLSPRQFKAIHSPMISDPEDTVGARCFDHGPEVKAEGKMVGLPCVRKRGHSGAHRSFQGEHPESRVFYEW
jgi:hypothetical protein